MNIIDAYKFCIKNYGNFEGRARRSEYFGFALTNFLIVLGILVLGWIIPLLLFLIPLYVLGTIIPAIAALVRRLHDVGKSGWWYFIAFVPLIGGIWLLVLLFTEGESGDNIYGSNPKLAYDNDIDLIGQN